MVFLIFFTSLGSAVAASDNASLDDYSSISDSICLSEESSSLDISIESNSLNVNSSDDFGSVESSDELDLANDYLNDSDSEESDSIESNLMEKNGSPKGKMASSAKDSSLTNSNDEIDLINSKSVKSKNYVSASSSSKIIIVNNASYYGNSVNSQIQKIIDDAEAGSTIQFTGSSYENIYLKISKPLNIISKSGTVIKNIFNVPVFTILEGGSGTNITGFKVNLIGSFVDAKNVSRITISKNKISTNAKAIVLHEVYDSKIQNNIFSKFNTAIDISNCGGIVIYQNNLTPSNSDNIGINLKNITSKKGISILNNNIFGFSKRKQSTGIYFAENACNVLIKGNVMKQWYTAIDLPYSVNNVTMINNTITENGDGVVINGWINNFTFNKNLVVGNGRVGVLFDYDFMGTNGNLTLENNYFSYNGVMDLQDKGDQAVSIGKNFAKYRCYRVGMKYGFYVKTKQNGNQTFFSVTDKNGNEVSDLPNFQATLNVGGKDYNVLFINGKAYLSGVNSASGNLDL